VNVVPLIHALELRVRSNVVAATSMEKTAGFGTANYNASHGYPQYSLPQTKQDTIMSIFDGTAPKDSEGNPLVRYDCRGMAGIEMAWGVIQVLKQGEFDKLNLSSESFTSWASEDTCFLSYYGLNSVALIQLEAGDMVRFANNLEYLNKHEGGAWFAEYAIKTLKIGTEIGDLYSGWNINGAFNHLGWKNLLLDAYNENLGYFDRITIDVIPGYSGEAWHINVPKLAQKIFDLRTSQMS